MLMEDKFLSSVFPQGYGFFTRKPKEDHLHIYKKINNNYELLTVNNSTGERFYGASRKTAKILLDLSFISIKIKEWENFDDWENISEKNGLNFKSGEIKLDDKYKGHYVFIKEEVIPWAWSRHLSESKKYYKNIIIQ